METSKHETLTVKGLDFVKIRRDGEVIDTISVKDDPESELSVELYDYDAD